uniref:Ubiquinol-cytochrome C reductase hinge domain-containing protein n=1 Tax=Leersia perrieri TaxID=77586 RepID=A0A0D9XPE3_9ORYZ
MASPSPLGLAALLSSAATNTLDFLTRQLRPSLDPPTHVTHDDDDEDSDLAYNESGGGDDDDEGNRQQQASNYRRGAEENPGSAIQPHIQRGMRADEELVDPKKYLEERCKPQCVKPLYEYEVAPKLLEKLK